VNISPKEKYISLGTFKRSGVIVRTPVWFVSHNGLLYVTTQKSSWKVKRIRKNPKVNFASCDARGRKMGEILDGTAKILDPTPEINSLFKKKYGILYRILNFRSKKKERIHLEIH